MSTFEIVRGVEGDCLVLDGTRICGPKPWGGGRTIDTFRTDGVYEVIDKDEYRRLMVDNAKLRELVDGFTWCCGHHCGQECPLYDASEPDYCRETSIKRDLGVEVDA